VSQQTSAKIKAGIAKFNRLMQETEFKVLVWAPGNRFYDKKRNNIIDQLTKNGFQAYTSEEFDEPVVTSVPLPVQEIPHWLAANLVLVLDAGPAPSMEIASYILMPAFLEKSIVFHPKDWDPAYQRTYPSDVLRSLVNRIPYTEQEIQDCIVTAECLHRAQAFKYCEVMKQHFSNTPITAFFE